MQAALFVWHTLQSARVCPTRHAKISYKYYIISLALACFMFQSFLLPLPQLAQHSQHQLSFYCFLFILFLLEWKSFFSSSSTSAHCQGSRGTKVRLSAGYRIITIVFLTSEIFYVCRVFINRRHANCLICLGLST